MLPDIDALSTYGGPLSNYSSVEDPTTDEDAKFRNRYAANVAMMTHTSPRAFMSFSGGAATPVADPAAGFVHDALWGNQPAVKPVAVYVSTGIYDVTWPVTVSSELTGATPAQGGGVTHTLNFRRAMAQVEQSDGTFRAAHARVTAPNKVRVYCYSGTVLSDLPGQVVSVWVW